MTDKLKELVAKWEARILHRLTIAENNPNRQEREVAEVTAEAFKLALNELKSALAEQSPAGEWAQDELLALTGEFTALVANEIEIQRGDWVNAWGVMRKELYSFFKRAYAAGRSSQS